MKDCARLCCIKVVLCVFVVVCPKSGSVCLVEKISLQWEFHWENSRDSNF